MFYCKSQLEFKFDKDLKLSIDSKEMYLSQQFNLKHSKSNGRRLTRILLLMVLWYISLLIIYS